MSIMHLENYKTEAINQLFTTFALIYIKKLVKSANSKNITENYDQKIIIFAIKVQKSRNKLELKSGFYDSSWLIPTIHNSNLKKTTTSPVFSQDNKLAGWLKIATPVN
ncbi:hypothetical protein BB561_003052 [Smittium simulii]|uniref:Uncharacterized protein n=1 Tax=Smittium simulii TaxID=133385 RepID=A0A2T9YN45_9FUNG|nr:hypothetical protein BB561_003052 [Smittium simulii]